MQNSSTPRKATANPLLTDLDKKLLNHDLYKKRWKQGEFPDGFWTLPPRDPREIGRRDALAEFWLGILCVAADSVQLCRFSAYHAMETFSRRDKVGLVPCIAFLMERLDSRPELVLRYNPNWKATALSSQPSSSSSSSYSRPSLTSYLTPRTIFKAASWIGNQLSPLIFGSDPRSSASKTLPAGALELEKLRQDYASVDFLYLPQIKVLSSSILNRIRSDIRTGVNEDQMQDRIIAVDDFKRLYVTSSNSDENCDSLLFYWFSKNQILLFTEEINGEPVECIKLASFEEEEADGSQVEVTESERSLLKLRLMKNHFHVKIEAMELEIRQAKLQALAAAKKNDQRAALKALRKSKNLSETLKQTEAKYDNLALLVNKIQEARWNIEYMHAQKQAADELHRWNKKMSVEEAEDIMDHVQDVFTAAEEVSTAIREGAERNNQNAALMAGLDPDEEDDKLLKELEEMMQQDTKKPVTKKPAAAAASAAPIVMKQQQPVQVKAPSPVIVPQQQQQPLQQRRLAVQEDCGEDEEEDDDQPLMSFTSNGGNSILLRLDDIQNKDVINYELEQVTAAMRMTSNPDESAELERHFDELEFFLEVCPEIDSTNAEERAVELRKLSKKVQKALSFYRQNAASPRQLQLVEDRLQGLSKVIQASLSSISVSSASASSASSSGGKDLSPSTRALARQLDELQIPTGRILFSPAAEKQKERTAIPQ